MSKFDIKNLELYYGDFKAVKGIDLKIEKNKPPVLVKTEKK